MSTIVRQTKTEDIKAAGKVLKQGGIVAFPTDTVYGLGAVFDDEKAVRKIFAAKGREEKKPLRILVADSVQVELLSEIKSGEMAQKAERLMKKYWPGALTLIFRKKPGIPDAVTAGGETIGIRMPNMELTRELIRAAGKPLAAPSANTSGKRSSVSAREVLEDLEAMDTIAKNAQAGDIGKALSPKTVENGVVTEWQYVEPGGGTEDYTDLENKPSIGGVTLSGDKSLTDLGIASAESVSELSGDVTDVKNAIHGTDNHIAGIEYGGKILSKNVKNALLNLFAHVAYTDGNAQQYIDALISAWGITATISAITAVFTQGSAVIMEGDDLDTLKAYLVVNGVYTVDEYSFEDEVTGYTLSGTLSEGESTITVTYNGMTTTFTVEVTPTLPSAYKKVEWIGTTGTQAIMFPSIIATTTAELEKYEFDIDFKFDQWQSNAATNIVAAFSSYGGCWIGYNNNVGNIAMGTSSGMYFTDNQPTVRHQYHYSFGNGSGKYERDDHTSITRAFSSPAYSAVFALFCSTVKYEGGSTYFNDEFKFIGKLYGMTMTYEGEPLLELIPCYRKSDNVIGLYDMVGGTFYVNNGTGTFTKGDDV